MDTTKTHTPEPLLLTRREVARLLSTSDRHVRHLTEDGRLPSVRLGGKVRVHQRQLDDFLDRLCLSEVATPDARSEPPEAKTDEELRRAQALSWAVHAVAGLLVQVVEEGELARND